MIATEIRAGAYYDSVVLMQVQRALNGLRGVQDAAVVMGLPSNLDLLRQGNLYTPELADAGMDDLIIAIRGDTMVEAEEAIAQFDRLLALRTSSAVEQDYLPKTLAAATRSRPESAWVLVSVPGRYAASVAEEALMLGKHVFLYSDNVALDDEVRLKQLASRRSLLLMGPDCGTAMINGIGLGFANVTRRGNIGVVSASGTGLQHVAASIHHRGGGISHGFGTGGRDMSEEVGGLTTLQCLELLASDPDMQVIVLISKPPSLQVSQRVLSRAATLGKPVVVYLIGLDSDPDLPIPAQTLHIANSLEHAAELACHFSEPDEQPSDGLASDAARIDGYADGQRFIRGLFSGGTLALECINLLQRRGHQVNAKLSVNDDLAGHIILDLGDDAFTVGRLHPMLDNDLRIRRLQIEAEDPGVAIVLMDCVLGYGAHPDPAAELAPAIAQAREAAMQGGRRLDVLVTVIGTDEDPQDYAAQCKALTDAGARVFHSNAAACLEAARTVEQITRNDQTLPITAAMREQPFSAINVGLLSFAKSIEKQGASVQHVDWRPPARGNERLMGILARMKQSSP